MKPARSRSVERSGPGEFRLRSVTRLTAVLLALALSVSSAGADGGAVSFQSDNPDLQTLHDSAVEKAQRFLVEYAPVFQVLANTGDYNGLFLENAVLNAESYARFDPAVGIRTVQAHFLTQREQLNQAPISKP